MIKNRLSTYMGYKRMKIAEVARIANLRYNTVYNLYYNQTKGIDFATLDKLCFALDCNPNDLFRYVPD